MKICLLVFFAVLSISSQASPKTFSKAKEELRQFVYFDQTSSGTFYCGCTWDWTGASSGLINISSCGYKIRTDKSRAGRLEWEHIVPASDFGRARQCWQNGGRNNCTATDPLFNVMEADMHNLVPSVGEVNRDRSNYNFGVLSSSSASYGACTFEVDFKMRIAEPRDDVKGKIARTHFYFYDRYNLSMSKQQQQLFIAWNKMFPVTEDELLIHTRITNRIGHSNPFITGVRKWELGHINSGEGLRIGQTSSKVTFHKTSESIESNQVSSKIRGNKNSRIYHLATGCPSYDKIAKSNYIEFTNEVSAINAGFRKAGNCKVD